MPERGRAQIRLLSLQGPSFSDCDLWASAPVSCAEAGCLRVGGWENPDINRLPTPTPFSLLRWVATRLRAGQDRGRQLGQPLPAFCLPFGPWRTHPAPARASSPAVTTAQTQGGGQVVPALGVSCLPVPLVPSDATCGPGTWQFTEHLHGRYSPLTLTAALRGEQSPMSGN